jgi:hypothetical protein
MRRRLLVGISTVALAAAFASPVGADPSNAANSMSMEIVCGAETITTVFNGNGIFAPLHDLNSSSVFTPVALDVTLTFTPTGGGQPSVDHAIVGKSAPAEGAVTCTIPLQPLFSNPQGSTTIAGTLSGFWTPRV